MPDDKRRAVQSLYPTLAFKDCSKAVAFYEKAFGAKTNSCMKAPNGRVAHAELDFFGTVVMMSDEFPDSPVKAPSGASVTGGFYLYVPDVDAFVKKAAAAGCKPTMPVTDMFYGDRVGALVDPFGYHWTIGTHKEDPTEEQVAERAKAFFAKMAGAKK